MHNDSVLSRPDANAAGQESIRLLYRKIAWRIMPILFLGFVISSIDRSNIGFAKLQMQNDLGFSNSVYGIGAGIFFIGYFVLEVPSNLLLHRLGARVWITRIMVTWGVVSVLMFLTRGPASFYLLRFLLGIAEAGLVPGVILYLTYWFPSARRARMVAVFYTAVAASGIVGGPAAGWIMAHFAGFHGLAGWQWLFILEGVPAVLLAAAVYRYLDDNPDRAAWLTPAQRAFVTSQLDSTEQDADAGAWRVFGTPLMWLLTTVFFMICVSMIGVAMWLPTLIQATGVSDVFHVGLLSAVPYLVATMAMILVSRHSDRTGERRWHVALPMIIGAGGLGVSVAYDHNTLIALGGLTVATTGILSAMPPFWSVPAGFLRGRAAAAGIAMINALGNLGGFFGPFFIGYTRDLTHSTASGITAIAVALAIGGVLMLAVPTSKRLRVVSSTSVSTVAS
ncbi:MFS transporter [Paraburkholderia sp. BL27I4N3]|uniref:MFS transporter n=1 Tax=Paraburkholderia sp. BL27I4N3 TaxID=1938805 RepID=UPI000E288176|nr:MFS transporter [Paraburkholderia sp. BL27I4N3]REE07332.1 MFS transporter [Paraburkholderia sp. BL27I4N3]